MTRENFERILRSISGRTPFRPFTLELANGSRIEVNHPEALTIMGEILVCTSTTSLRSAFEIASVVRIIGATGTS